MDKRQCTYGGQDCGPVTHVVHERGGDVDACAVCARKVSREGRRVKRI